MRGRMPDRAQIAENEPDEGETNAECRARKELSGFGPLASTLSIGLCSAVLS